METAKSLFVVLLGLGAAAFIGFILWDASKVGERFNASLPPEETGHMKKLDSNATLIVYSYTDETGEYRVFVSKNSSYQPSAIKVK